MALLHSVSFLLSFFLSFFVNFFNFWFTFLWLPKNVFQFLEEASFLVLGGWLLLFGVCDGASASFFLTAWANRVLKSPQAS